LYFEVQQAVGLGANESPKGLYAVFENHQSSYLSQSMTEANSIMESMCGESLSRLVPEHEQTFRTATLMEHAAYPQAAS
jgi:thiaminase